MHRDHYYNRFPKGPIVQKYGGTSVGDAERINLVADRIKKLVELGFQQLAIVVSARAGETNRLVELIQEVHPEPPAAAYDMAVAAGEQVSVALLSAALARRGLTAAPFLAYQLGILTDESHSKARILKINTDPLAKAFASGRIPVIAGFQGVTEDGSITTLGRGGSDTSAVALAVAMRASLCEINTDVDGVYSADPRYVPEARLMSELDYEVALEMASLGSKVLHPRCVELGAKYSLPLVVRNTFTPDEHQRTCIMPRLEGEHIESPVVAGVSVDRKVTKMTLVGLPDDSKVVSGVFEAVGAAEINVDIIIHQIGQEGRMQLGFTIGDSDKPSAVRIIEGVLRERGLDGAKLLVEQDLAKVSVVGVGMRSHSGVASRTFSALTKAGIDIHMISTSEIKISCVVAANAADAAARALHATFFEG